MFEVNPNRKFDFEYEVKEGEWVTVTFDFPWSEDIDYTQVRILLKDIPKFEKGDRVKKMKDGKSITKEEADLMAESKSLQVYYNLMRKSLVGCSGFGHKDKEFSIYDEDGKIIENNQKCIFDFVKVNQTLMDKVSLAYAGEVDEGNVKIGLPPVSPSDGTPESASPAS